MSINDKFNGRANVRIERAPETESNAFVNAVKHYVGTIDYIHRDKNSGVVSLRNVFLAFLRKKTKGLNEGITESTSKYTFASTCVGLATQTIAITFNDSYDLSAKLVKALKGLTDTAIARVSHLSASELEKPENKVVTFLGVPTEKDIAEVISYLALDYAAGNTFITAEVVNAAFASRNVELAKEMQEMSDSANGVLPAPVPLELGAVAS